MLVYSVERRVLQAKVQEPELYQLHERVRQIRSNLESSDVNKADGMLQHMSQEGVAVQ